MAKKTQKTKTTPYDSADYFDSRKAINAYMEEALETEEPAFIAQALSTVARARGMAHVAKKAGLSRESLYKALSTEGNPQFGTIIRVMRALDSSSPSPMRMLTNRRPAVPEGLLGRIRAGLTVADSCRCSGAGCVTSWMACSLW